MTSARFLVEGEGGFVLEVPRARVRVYVSEHNDGLYFEFVAERGRWVSGEKSKTAVLLPEPIPAPEGESDGR